MNRSNLLHLILPMCAAATFGFVGCSMTSDPLTSSNNGNNTDITDSTALTDSTAFKDSIAEIDKGTVVGSIEKYSLAFYPSAEDPTHHMVGCDTLAMSAIREKINNKGVLLSTFTITNLGIGSVNGNDTFLVTNQFIAAHAASKMVLTASTTLPGNAAVPALTSPDSTSIFPIRSFSGLSEPGLVLMDGLYAVNPGYSNFVTMVRDLSVDSVIVTIDIRSADALTVPEGLKLRFTITAEGKKPF